MAQVLLGQWTLLAVWALVPVLSFRQIGKRVSADKIAQALIWASLPVVATFIYFHGQIFGQILRFQFNNSFYERIVAEANAGRCSQTALKGWEACIDAIDCSAPVTIVFPWGGFAGIWHGVVYDAADEIVKHAPQRTMGWKHRAIGRLLSCSGGYATLGNHFYLASGFDTDFDECG